MRQHTLNVKSQPLPFSQCQHNGLTKFHRLGRWSVLMIFNLRQLGGLIQVPAQLINIR